MSAIICDKSRGGLTINGAVAVISCCVCGNACEHHFPFHALIMSHFMHSDFAATVLRLRRYVCSSSTSLLLCSSSTSLPTIALCDRGDKCCGDGIVYVE